MKILKQQHLDKHSQKDPDSTDKEAMVRNNIGWMICVADRLLGDRALAEDVVQEAFISAFRGLDKFQNRSTLRTWLHRITVNTALMKLRQLKRLAEQPIDEYLPEFDTNAGAPCYLTKFRDSCRLNSFTYAANGRCPERPASVTTTHKSRFVITPSNGWTAIRNAILASLARYRALRLSELPCRLSGTKNHHFAIAPFP